jgi:toxin HigB-1
VNRSFRDKALKRYWETSEAVGLSVPNVERVGRMLRALDVAERPEDVGLPGYRFHRLHGSPRRWSLHVTGNWRLTFGWDGADAIDIEVEDYHGR